jgi:hypothetical protein
MISGINVGGKTSPGGYFVRRTPFAWGSAPSPDAPERENRT